jgi:hypothetical protein
MNDNAPIDGCSGCASSGGRMVCPTHGFNRVTQVSPAGVTEATFLWHAHAWRYDGVAPTGGFVYHCDAHDPPVVRVVTP